MTVAAQIDQANVRLEYILCIEGMGWPPSLSDLSTSWGGDLFATTDLNGTLESDLGLAAGGLSLGLELPSGVSEEFDPRTLKFSTGSLTFTIIDHDDKLRTKVTPELSTGVTDVLYEDLGYENKTIHIDNATNTFANDDLIWIADSELVQLKNKTLVSGTEYKYLGSTRGVYGTPIGRVDDNPLAVTAFAWLGSNTGNGQATKIRTWLRRWYNKRVALLAKVPGEAKSTAVLIYKGRIRNIGTIRGGIGFRIGTTSDIAGGYAGRIRRGPPPMTVVSDEFVETSTGSQGRGTPTHSEQGSGFFEPDFSIMDSQVHTYSHKLTVETSSESNYAHYVPAFAYQYRQFIAGGTSGVRAAIKANPKIPQAYVDSNGNDILGLMVSINGNTMQALYSQSDWDYREITIQSANWDTGSVTTETFDDGSEIYFLLDNITDSVKRSRWVINNRISRNAIDVLLAFLTSTNNEYYLETNPTSIGAVTLADGTKAHRVTFTPSISWNTDEWVGFGLHCTTGNNIGEMREIVANTGTTIDVIPPFPSTTATGHYQIRNTIYDILPIGWGIGIPNDAINVASFESVRDKYLESANLGKFAIGDSGDVDVWNLVQENICAPYGILMYADRFTGKLAARYIGDRAVPSGVDETYPTLTTSQILDIGEIDYMPRPQISSIRIKVRETQTATIRPVIARLPTILGGMEYTATYADETVSSIGDDAKLATIIIQDEEGDMVFQNDLTESIEYTAMFHDKRSAADLSLRMVSRLNRERIPDPEVTIRVDLSQLDTLQAGAIYAITENTRFKPINPFTGTRGWTGLLGLVRSVSYSFGGSNPGIEARVILLSESASARIAPAALVASKGNDAGGDYFVVSDYGSSDYASDVNTLDWALFAVDDRITIRDKTGANQESEVIKGFGSNLATTPASASDARVYVDGTIARTIATGDYITFDTYSTASNTTNQNAHVAYADAAETIDATAADKYA